MTNKTIGFFSPKGALVYTDGNWGQEKVSGLPSDPPPSWQSGI